MPRSEPDDASVKEIVLNEPANTIDPPRDPPLEHAAELENFAAMLRSKRPLPRPAESSSNNETSFFRDFAPFELLRRSILPKLIELKRPQRTLTIWSAASSTGQEAYSLAMMLCEDFPELADWDVKIIATDISPSSHAYARAGRYRRLEVNRGLPARLLLKYFERDRDEWQISAKVRSMVDFQSANLRALMPSLPKFDLVLLRNVLLYFPPQDRGAVLTLVHGMMHPHGVLLLGNAEQAEDSTDLFGVEFDTGCYYYKPKVSQQ
jgi:chemotaxis protein methyltransferase CheR